MSNRLSANKLLISTLAKRKTSKNPLQAGFTLVELLIVVIIIGILAAVAVPAFLNQQGRARINASQIAAISAARACVAAQVTGDQALFVVPANVTASAACPAAGTPGTFTSVGFVGPAPAVEAIASVSAVGEASLTGCATTAGWLNPSTNAPACTPVRG